MHAGVLARWPTPWRYENGTIVAANGLVVLVEDEPPEEPGYAEHAPLGPFLVMAVNRHGAPESWPEDEAVGTAEA